MMGLYFGPVGSILWVGLVFGSAVNGNSRSFGTIFPNFSNFKPASFETTRFKTPVTKFKINNPKTNPKI